jgi:hypothetical protein
MGDWLGYLLMGSFLLVWWGNLPTRKRDGLALISMVFLVGLAGWLSFYLRAIRLLPAPSLALLLPPMALGAIVYQQRGATLLTLVAALLMATFAKGWDDAQPLEFRDAFFGWLFLAINFSTLMTLAASICQTARVRPPTGAVAPRTGTRLPAGAQHFGQRARARDADVR